MVSAAQKHELPHPSAEVERLAHSMTRKQVHDFASTKGLASGGMAPHGMRIDSSVVPKAKGVPGFGAGIAKAPKPPEGVRPSEWWEHSEARQMTHSGGFAAGGGIGRPGLQFGGGTPDSWVERQEAYHELAVPHGGFLNSSVAGRTDRLPLAVATDSHVIPADVVSGLGQSNSLSGARVLSEALRVGPYGTAHAPAIRGHGPPRPPTDPALARGIEGQASGGKTHDKGVAHTLMAGGEFVISPDDWTDGRYTYRGVRSIGGGDLAEGHRRLREMTRRVREHTMKFLKNAPPPKR